MTNRSRRGSTGSRKGSLEPSSTEPSNVLRVTALGSNDAVTIPSDAKHARTVEEITDRMSVVKITDGHNVICVTETKGHIKLINELVKRHDARAVIHTGDFGFHDAESYKHLSLKELRNLIQFGPVSGPLRARLLHTDDSELRKACQSVSLSELPLFIAGQERLEVPVYVIWGNQEDVHVLKKFADGSYHVPNLYILSPDSSFTVPVGEYSLRLFGVGGAFLYHRLFDIGHHGTPQVSGDEGVMWATLIQLGNLIELSERYKDPKEVRILVTHVCPGKEGLVNILASAIRADYTLSGALHGKFTHVYTDFSVRTHSNYLDHISSARNELPRLWKHVLDVLGESNIRDTDKHAVQCVLKHLSSDQAKTEFEMKHIWHLNLPDVKNGHVLLRFAGDELKIEPIVDNGWHLSLARDTTGTHRRPSHHKDREARQSVAEEPKRKEDPQHQPKPIRHQATAPSVPPQTAPAVLSASIDEVNLMPTAANLLKVTGFPANLPQSELDRKFSFNRFKTSECLYDSDAVYMGFDEEKEFARASKSLSNMRYDSQALVLNTLRKQESALASPAESPKETVVAPSNPALVDEPTIGQRRPTLN